MSLKFSPPFMNASGVKCTTERQLVILDDNPNVGAIVSKTCTFLPKKGDPSNIHLDDFGSVNAIKLHNPGYQYYLNILKNRVFRKPFILSIHASIPKNIWQIINETKDFVQGYELNISCPNVEELTYSIEKILATIPSSIYKTHIIGVKVGHFNRKDIDILNDFPIHYVVCSNTLPGILDGHQGGIGGKYIKPFSLANVHFYRKYLRSDIQIIGCGGIYSKKDAEEYFGLGCVAVQVGTAYLKDDGIFAKL